MLRRNDRKNKDATYKKIEAMYHKGYSVSEICNATGKSPISVICIMQKIFAKSQM